MLSEARSCAPVDSLTGPTGTCRGSPSSHGNVESVWCVVPKKIIVVDLFGAERRQRIYAENLMTQCEFKVGMP